jgi:1-phosphofructokinase family hexose kinase
LIVTLTPNPSLDLLFAAERLVWDDANRVSMPRRRPGGQGINVVRAALALAAGAAGPTAAGAAGRAVAHAVAPLGGVVGRELRAVLDAEGTPLTAVPIAGETRLFVGVRESAGGRSLLLNPRGPEATEAEAAAVLDALDGVLSDGAADWVAACGSLLPGMPADFYARAGRLARDRGARFVPDGDGEALAAAVPEADLLVPNDREAERLLGRPVDGPGAAAAAARELLERGPRRVVVTLGAAGAVSADRSGSWWARPVPPPDRAAMLASSSAVGAGDAFLAALLLAVEVGAPAAESLTAAVAAGTAVLLSTGSDLVTAAGVEEARGWVVVERI